jgi:hypothetical protein
MGQSNRSSYSQQGKKTLSLAVIVVFSALIAIGTIVSIRMPKPLYEITWAPAVYLALGYLTDRRTSFSATALGSFIGELVNITFYGGGSIIYPFGMIWARGPEALIVGFSRGRSWKWIILMMILATVYETFAFYISDGLFYAYGLFGYGAPSGLLAGFELASSDLLTMVDLIFIPISLAVIKVGKPTFARIGFFDFEKRVTTKAV